MDDYAMVDLMQGITHVHLVQTEVWHQPKRIEEHVTPCTRALPFIRTTGRSLFVGPAIIPELYHWTASSRYSC
jgi:hypothetical protein